MRNYLAYGVGFIGIGAYIAAIVNFFSNSEKFMSVFFLAYGTFWLLLALMLYKKRKKPVKDTVILGEHHSEHIYLRQLALLNETTTVVTILYLYDKFVIYDHTLRKIIYSIKYGKIRDVYMDKNLYIDIDDEILVINSVSNERALKHLQSKTVHGKN